MFLSPSKKYDIYVQLMRGQTMVGAAAAQAGVDRSTIMRLRQVARQGAVEALAHGQESRVSLPVTSCLTRPGPRLTDSRTR